MRVAMADCFRIGFHFGARAPSGLLCIAITKLAQLSLGNEFQYILVQGVLYAVIRKLFTVI